MSVFYPIPSKSPSLAIQTGDRFRTGAARGRRAVYGHENRAGYRGRHWRPRNDQGPNAEARDSRDTGSIVRQGTESFLRPYGVGGVINTP